MLNAVRTSVVGRLSAAAVAVVLTGAPALVARADQEREHRCQCRTHAGGRECSCQRCHQPRAAPETKEQARPPCHGARSGAATRPPRAGRGEGQARRGAPPGPFMVGCCGAPEPPKVVLTSIEWFALPRRVPMPAPRGPTGTLLVEDGLLLDTPVVPELPPPRVS